MEKKKIVYIHHGKGLGGAPLSLLYLIQSLDKEKYHPIVVFLHQSSIIDLYKKNNIDVIGPVNVYDFAHTKIWWFKWYHFHYLFRAIKDTLKTIFFIAPNIFDSIKPDMVHLNTSSLIGWGYVAHKKNIPVIWHIREPLAPGYCGLRRWIVTTCVKKYATKILPICKHDALPWKKNKKTQIVYNAASITTFNRYLSPDNFLKKHNLHPDTPKILFLGGLSREKGTHVILKAFLKLQQKLPDAQLLLAGNFDTNPTWSPLPGGWYKRSVISLLQQAESHAADSKKMDERLQGYQQKSIILLGPITDVPEAMAASEVIVFPATVGHFARPIIEASLMAKPVIASHLSPLDELVAHQETGFRIDPNNYQEWADRLFLLLTNASYAKSMGKAGYHFAQSRFTLDAQKIIVKQIYDKHTHKE